MTKIPRRMVLSALALGLTAVASCGDRTDRGPLRIAAGEPGGLYLAFADQLATEINIAELWLRVTPMPTNGSLDNLQRLAAGSAELAIVLAEAAQAATRTDGPPPAPVPIRAIGRVYENYLQLVVLATGPIRRLSDLAGRTVSLGAPGSGAELTGGWLLRAAGLTDAAVTVEHHALSDAITALEEGRIAALLWFGGVPTPALTRLSARRGIRLLPLATVLPALRSAYGPVYQPVTVPADVYGPAPEVTTIGMANLLVCRPDIDPAVTAAVARVLVTHAAKLVPQQVQAPSSSTRAASSRPPEYPCTLVRSPPTGRSTADRGVCLRRAVNARGLPQGLVDTGASRPRRGSGVNRIRVVVGVGCRRCNRLPICQRRRRTDRRTGSAHRRKPG